MAALPDLAGHCHDRWRRLVAVDLHYHMCVTSLQQWNFFSALFFFGSTYACQCLHCYFEARYKPRTIAFPCRASHTVHSVAAMHQDALWYWSAPEPT